MSDTIDTNNFNKNLLELLCNDISNDVSDDVSDDVNDTCLISNMELKDNHIKLSCGHTFNYSPIFNEIQKQKYNKSHYYEVQKLNSKQIKCPYCRKVQNGILPYYEGFPQILNVNWPPKNQFLPNDCKYIFVSGKKINTACNKKCSDKYCNYHFKIIKNREEKEAKKINKINKQGDKQKNKALQFVNNIMSKSINTVLQKNTSPSTSLNKCNYIFKKGKLKGDMCTCKLYKNNFCRKHYRLQQKKAPWEKNKPKIIDPTPFFNNGWTITPL